MANRTNVSPVRLSNIRSAMGRTGPFRFSDFRITPSETNESNVSLKNGIAAVPTTLEYPPSVEDGLSVNIFLSFTGVSTLAHHLLNSNASWVWSFSGSGFATTSQAGVYIDGVVSLSNSKGQTEFLDFTLANTQDCAEILGDIVVIGQIQIDPSRGLISL